MINPFVVASMVFMEEKKLMRANGNVINKSNDSQKKMDLKSIPASVTAREMNQARSPRIARMPATLAT